MDPIDTIVETRTNSGRRMNSSNRMYLPACIYVDNVLMLTLDVDHMKMVLAATIKAIFVVMGKPDAAVRQCPLSMDKWIDLVIRSKQTMLGLIIDTNRLTVTGPNTSKTFLIYSTLLGTQTDVVSKCQKPKSSREN